jgi:SAM-dependent methyltransferase
MFVQADATRMPFRDGAIDISFHQGLLEHFRDPRPLLRENARITARGGRVLVDVPQTWHLYTLMKNVLILANRWFAGWETQFTVGELERLVREAGLDVVRSYGDWMVPGLWYRVTREVLKRGAGARLPLHPSGPAWWSGGWERWREWLRGRRWALNTCHVIGTVGRRP